MFKSSKKDDFFDILDDGFQDFSEENLEFGFAADSTQPEANDEAEVQKQLGEINEAKKDMNPEESKQSSLNLQHTSPSVLSAPPI